MTASPVDPDPERVAEVLVTLTGESGVSRRGSGYLVADGLVLSAAHVVDGAANVVVRFNADQPSEWSSPAAVVWCDPQADLVVLRLSERHPQAVVDAVRVGWVPVRAV